MCFDPHHIFKLRASAVKINAQYDTVFFDRLP
jgi:hypothetical protein